MKIKGLSAIFLSLVMMFTCFTGILSVYATTTSVDNGVVSVEDSYADKSRYIYYPEELNSNTKKYPVIIWANGTGCQPSMYLDLFKGFAKQGFVVVASSETMAADGKDQIASLDYISGKSSPLYNRVDTTRVTAMGHSQGGRSAVNSAVSDNRFCCVVSIAGSNYQDEAKLLKAPTLFLTGTSDSIVSSSKWVKPAYDVCKGAAVYASLVGAKHTTCCNEPERYIDYCVSWINAWINADDNALSVFKSNSTLANDASWCDVVNKNLTNNISGQIILTPAECTYDGKVKTPKVTVKDYRGAVISSENYSVKYDKGRREIGKYKLTISYRNKYSGSKSVYFCIVPKGTSISRLTATKSGFKASWGKQTSQTNGYQIQYSTSSKFKGAKIVTVKNNKSTSKNISKLSSGKKYYVRVRTYKTVGKTRCYSAWSKVKTVKITK